MATLKKKNFNQISLFNQTKRSEGEKKISETKKLRYEPENINSATEKNNTSHVKINLGVKNENKKFD